MKIFHSIKSEFYHSGSERGEGVISVMLGLLLTTFILAVGISMAVTMIDGVKISQNTNDIMWIVDRAKSLKRTTNNYSGAAAVPPTPVIPIISNTVIISNTEVPNGLSSGTGTLTNEFGGNITVTQAINATPTLSIAEDGIPDLYCIDAAMNVAGMLKKVGLIEMNINGRIAIINPFVNVVVVSQSCDRNTPLNTITFLIQ